MRGDASVDLRCYGKLAWVQVLDLRMKSYSSCTTEQDLQYIYNMSREIL